MGLLKKKKSAKVKKGQYITKPKVVDAFIFGEEKLPDWMHKAVEEGVASLECAGTSGAHYLIDGRVGFIGDYIIREDSGYIYPLKAVDFRKQFEKV